jgi:hypothetical protein
VEFPLLSISDFGCCLVTYFPYFVVHFSCICTSVVGLHTETRQGTLTEGEVSCKIFVPLGVTSRIQQLSS